MNFEPRARTRTALATALAAGALATLAALAPACTADVYPPTVGGYQTVYVDSVPSNIRAYPHTYYGGGDAYLVGNSWYYPTGNRWVVMQQEPPQLYRYRTNYVQQAPPAYRPAPYDYRYQPSPRQVAPPAQYGYPPPAVRVR